jgi:hypothetical protein
MATTINSPQDMTKYLNDYQTKLSALDNYDPLGGTTVDKFAQDKLGMKFDMPDLPNYAQTHQDLRKDLNLDELEGNMNMYKDLIRKEELLAKQQRSYLKDQPVRMGVIEGRVDKATQDRQEQISWYSSELQRAGDMVTSAYNLINMTMQFKQMDYEAARENVTQEFNMRLSVFNAINEESWRQKEFEYKKLTDERDFAVDEYRDRRDFDYKKAYEERAFASTQYSMYASWIADGSLTWDRIDAGQKAEIAKMETMMGIPIGTMSKLKMPAGADIIATTPYDDNKGGHWLSILRRDPSTGATISENVKVGSYKVLPSKAPAGAKLGAVEKMREAGVYDEVYNGLTAKSGGKDPYVSPSTYNANRSYWVNKGGNANDFDKEFGAFINPNHFWNVKDGVWSGTNYLTGIAPDR